jgi:hypothetical protein
MAEHQFGTAIPQAHAALAVREDHGVRRRFDDTFGKFEIVHGIAHGTSDGFAGSACQAQTRTVDEFA